MLRSSKSLNLIIKAELWVSQAKKAYGTNIV